MTKVTISGNASGTGNVNFAAPNTNSAITVTLPTSNVNMDNLGPTTTAGAVTTYGFLLTASNYGAYSVGTTIAGSALRWSDVNYKYGGTPSGTWQICGATDSTDRPSVWQRIS